MGIYTATLGCLLFLSSCALASIAVWAYYLRHSTLLLLVGISGYGMGVLALVGLVWGSGIWVMVEMSFAIFHMVVGLMTIVSMVRNHITVPHGIEVALPVLLMVDVMIWSSMATTKLIGVQQRHDEEMLPTNTQVSMTPDTAFDPETPHLASMAEKPYANSAALQKFPTTIALTKYPTVLSVSKKASDQTLINDEEYDKSWLGRKRSVLFGKATTIPRFPSILGPNRTILKKKLSLRQAAKQPAKPIEVLPETNSNDIPEVNWDSNDDWTTEGNWMQQQVHKNYSIPNTNQIARSQSTSCIGPREREHRKKSLHNEKVLLSSVNPVLLPPVLKSGESPIMLSKRLQELTNNSDEDLSSPPFNAKMGTANETDNNERKVYDDQNEYKLSEKSSDHEQNEHKKAIYEQNDHKSTSKPNQYNLTAYPSNYDVNQYGMIPTPNQFHTTSLSPVGEVVTPINDYVGTPWVCQETNGLDETNMDSQELGGSSIELGRSSVELANPKLRNSPKLGNFPDLAPPHQVKLSNHPDLAPDSSLPNNSAVLSEPSHIHMEHGSAPLITSVDSSSLPYVNEFGEPVDQAAFRDFDLAYVREQEDKVTEESSRIGSSHKISGTDDSSHSTKNTSHSTKRSHSIKSSHNLKHSIDNHFALDSHYDRYPDLSDASVCGSPSRQDITLDTIRYSAAFDDTVLYNNSGIGKSNLDEPFWEGKAYGRYGVVNESLDPQEIPTKPRQLNFEKHQKLSFDKPQQLNSNSQQTLSNPQQPLPGNLSTKTSFASGIYLSKIPTCEENIDEYDRVLEGLESIPRISRQASWAAQPTHGSITPQQWDKNRDVYHENRTQRLLSGSLRVPSAHPDNIDDVSDVGAGEGLDRDHDHFSNRVDSGLRHSSYLGRSHSAPLLHTFRKPESRKPSDRLNESDEFGVYDEALYTTTVFPGGIPAAFLEFSAPFTPSQETMSPVVTSASSSPVRKFFQESPKRISSVFRRKQSIDEMRGNRSHKHTNSAYSNQVSLLSSASKLTGGSPRKSLRSFLTSKSHKHSQLVPSATAPASALTFVEGLNLGVRKFSVAQLRNDAIDFWDVRTANSLEREQLRVSSVPSDVVGEYDREKWRTLQALKERSALHLA